MLILVTGASGSGTSTLAAGLSRELGHKHLEADDYCWLPTYPPFSQKRDPVERSSLVVRTLRAQTDAVLAGSIVGWGSAVEDAFDVIVFLYLDAAVRKVRLREREIERFGQANEEFLELAAQYDTGPKRAKSLPRHQAWLQGRRCPILILSGDLTVQERLTAVLAYLSGLRNKPA
jgi:uridine kinase